MAKSYPPRTPITVDCHIDIPWITTKIGGIDLTVNNGGQYSETDFPRMQKGGLQSAVFALYLSDKMQDEYGRGGSLNLIYKQVKFIEEQAGCVIVDDPDVALDCVESGFVPIFLGLESGRLIYDSLSLLGKYRQLGVRYLTVTHNKNTSWADSATDIPKYNGLTTFGKTVVHEANRLGILMDISHGSEETARDVIENTNLPVIASHSGCAKLVNNPRNLTDELIKGIAQTMGVVHIPFARRFVGNSYKAVVDHVDHICQTVGPIYVGIGSDLDGAELVPGVTDVADWRKVVMEEMSSRGFTDITIAKVAGGNTLRVLTMGANLR